MQLLLNVIWLVFGGLWLALGYMLAGVILTITIIGIPFAVASFRIGFYALWPFGRRLVDRPSAGIGSGIGNVLWLLLAGWWLTIMHLITGIAHCITIIGIPLGIANFKLIPAALLPLGRSIIDADHPNAFMGR